MNPNDIEIVVDNIEDFMTFTKDTKEVVEGIVSLNEKYIGMLEAMESKYVTKQVDEINIVERETKQLEESMVNLLANIIEIKFQICTLDENTSKF